MALESFSRSIEVDADRAHTWEVLTDVETLAEWVGIVQEVQTIRHLERYRAVLQDKVGPFKLRADLSVVVTVEEPGVRVVVSASGKDRAVDSKIKVDAVLNLADRGSGTSIAAEGSYQVTGKVAGMGSGVIHKKADRILDDFFGNASRVLGAERVGNGSAN